MARLLEQYNQEIRPKLKQELAYTNAHRVPKLEKIVINMGLGEAARDNKKLAAAVQDLALISGQKPVVTKAKRSVAGFKIREGMNIGIKVTLRRSRMYEFMDRLVNVALPRVRDLRGYSMKSFDAQGNFNLGIKEQIIFPEIDYDKTDVIRGMDVTFVTNAESKWAAYHLLASFGLPFEKKES